jgi:hypothetical protein
MKQWMKIEDRKPKVGDHIFAIGQNADNTQWLWWGFWNPKRDDGQPENEFIYWIKMPPFPIMPEMKKQELEVEDGQENKENPKDS